MPDLRKAALAEEQKLAVKYLKPATAVVETFTKFGELWFANARSKRDCHAHCAA